MCPVKQSRRTVGRSSSRAKDSRKSEVRANAKSGTDSAQWRQVDQPPDGLDHTKSMRAHRGALMDRVENADPQRDRWSRRTVVATLAMDAASLACNGLRPRSFQMTTPCGERRQMVVVRFVHYRYPARSTARVAGGQRCWTTASRGGKDTAVAREPTRGA